MTVEIDPGSSGEPRRIDQERCFLVSALVSTATSVGHRAALKFATSKDEALGLAVSDWIFEGQRIESTDATEISKQAIERIVTLRE